MSDIWRIRIWTAFCMSKKIFKSPLSFTLSGIHMGQLCPGRKHTILIWASSLPLFINIQHGTGFASIPGEGSSNLLCFEIGLELSFFHCYHWTNEPLTPTPSPALYPGAIFHCFLSVRLQIREKAIPIWKVGLYSLLGLLARLA